MKKTFSHLHFRCSVLASVLTVVLLLFFCSVSFSMEEPWSVNSRWPVFDSSSVSQKKDSSPDFNPLIIAVNGFQKFISPVDGDRCTLHPTCSAYSKEAIKKHGTIKGFIMTSDRLLHEADESSYAPIIKINGKLRYYDPVEYNDFW